MTCQVFTNYGTGRGNVHPFIRLFTDFQTFLCEEQRMFTGSVNFLHQYKRYVLLLQLSLLFHFQYNPNNLSDLNNHNDPNNPNNLPGKPITDFSRVVEVELKTHLMTLLTLMPLICQTLWKRTYGQRRQMSIKLLRYKFSLHHS